MPSVPRRPATGRPDRHAVGQTRAVSCSGTSRASRASVPSLSVFRRLDPDAPADELASEIVGCPLAWGAVRATPARQAALIGTIGDVADHPGRVAVPAMAIAVAVMPVLAGARGGRRGWSQDAGREWFVRRHGGPSRRSDPVGPSRPGPAAAMIVTPGVKASRPGRGGRRIARCRTRSPGLALVGTVMSRRCTAMGRGRHVGAREGHAGRGRGTLANGRWVLAPLGVKKESQTWRSRHPPAGRGSSPTHPRR